MEEMITSRLSDSAAVGMSFANPEQSTGSESLMDSKSAEFHDWGS